jgi:alginate O-acetyltransferase complex protein AlgI
MLFNSIQFLIFFGFITLFYYSLRWSGRWILLLLASCYFYMVGIPYYILILFLTIVIDYWAGIWIEKSTGKNRKLALIISLISNIGILAYFKYYDFFIQNLNTFLGHFHVEKSFSLLQIALPIGLSFHTFQAMSYTIEVYRGQQKAERHFGIYALYVMFYPQLVAGPIERPQNLLPQFHTTFEYSWENMKAGLMRMAWGFFKKVVIADRLTEAVDMAYQNPADSNGLTLLLATFFFTFQIYCDFSGYSDIAIGAAQTMGFRLMENFKTPYFSMSISEFWRRWHISLSTWFKDYLYIPLGGNRGNIWQTYRNNFIVFLVSGLWHGANWTYVAWGGLHGAYLVAAQARNQFFPAFKLNSNYLINRYLHILITFMLVMFTWVFFRASSIQSALFILKKIGQFSLTNPLLIPFAKQELIFCFLLIIFLLWKERKYFNIDTSSNKSFWIFFLLIVTFSYIFGVFGSNQFIYFQF